MLDQNGALSRASVNIHLHPEKPTYTNINILQNVAQTHAAPLTFPSIGRLNPEHNTTITINKKYRLFTTCILKYFVGTNAEPHSYKIVQRIAALDKRINIIVVNLIHSC